MCINTNRHLVLSCMLLHGLLTLPCTHPCPHPPSIPTHLSSPCFKHTPTCTHIHTLLILFTSSHHHHHQDGVQVPPGVVAGLFPSPLTVVAFTNCDLYALPALEFREVIEQFPAFRAKLQALSLQYVCVFVDVCGCECVCVCICVDVCICVCVAHVIIKGCCTCSF